MEAEDYLDKASNKIATSQNTPTQTGQVLAPKVYVNEIKASFNKDEQNYRLRDVTGYGFFFVIISWILFMVYLTIALGTKMVLLPTFEPFDCSIPNHGLLLIFVFVPVVFIVLYLIEKRFKITTTNNIHNYYIGFGISMTVILSVFLATPYHSIKFEANDTTIVTIYSTLTTSILGLIVLILKSIFPSSDKN